MGMYRNHLVENDNKCRGGYVKDPSVIMLKYDGCWLPTKLIKIDNEEIKKEDKNEY